MCSPFQNIFKSSSESPNKSSRPPLPPIPEPEVPIHPYASSPPVQHTNYPGNISKIVINLFNVILKYKHSSVSPHTPHTPHTPHVYQPEDEIGSQTPVPPNYE
ncbi:hypothetical protein K501DRAFT_275712 [Backusella circina FSU 941]|nr:hypothetical protein K501DRAFT_275712 [Backusella circina FSU 941]